VNLTFRLLQRLGETTLGSLDLKSSLNTFAAEIFIYGLTFFTVGSEVVHYDVAGGCNTLDYPGVATV